MATEAVARGGGEGGGGGRAVCQAVPREGVGAGAPGGRIRFIISSSLIYLPACTACYRATRYSIYCLYILHTYTSTCLLAALLPLPIYTRLATGTDWCLVSAPWLSAMCITVLYE